MLDLRNQSKLDPNSITYLSNLIRQAASRLPVDQFSIMTKDNIQVMLPPDVKVEDCQGSCAVDTGRRLGAHWVMVGEVIKFGGSLRVSLSLHHSESAELRGSETVRGTDIESLEGPIQGAAVGLFSILDPKLKQTAERLKKGFVFETFSFSAIPDITDQLSAISNQEIPEIEVPEPSRDHVITGVNFGDLDIDGLELYDQAVRTENDVNATPQEKLEAWETVIAEVPKLKTEAMKRAKQWGKYIRQLEERKRVEERRAADREKKRLEGIEKLEALQAADELRERNRAKQMERDYSKLRRLLALRVVSKSDKLNWVEAFLEAYGATKALNPYSAQIYSWSTQLGERYKTLLQQSRLISQKARERKARLHRQLNALQSKEFYNKTATKRDDTIPQVSATPQSEDRPNDAIVLISCSSPQGTVWINGMPKGQSPVVYTGLPTKLMISCKLDDLVASRTLILRANQELEISLDLDEVKRAKDQKRQQHQADLRARRTILGHIASYSLIGALITSSAAGVIYLATGDLVSNRDQAFKHLQTSPDQMSVMQQRFDTYESQIIENNQTNRGLIYSSIGLGTISAISYWLMPTALEVTP